MCQYIFIKVNQQYLSYKIHHIRRYFIDYAIYVYVDGSGNSSDKLFDRRIVAAGNDDQL